MIPHIEPMITGRFADDTEESLCAMYQAYTTAEKLPAISADELIHEDLTVAQRMVVSAFIHRWDAYMHRHIPSAVTKHAYWYGLSVDAFQRLPKDQRTRG